jgi:Tfp pilus assembly protein PilZ
MPRVGDKFKSILTGATYVVRRIKDKMVILERLNDKKSQLFTELSNLKLFYKKEEREEKAKPPNFERRRYPRFSVDLPVEYTRKDLVVKQGRVINASEGGLLVNFPEQMEIGQHLRLKLFLTSGSELNMMELMNQVVWMDVHRGKDRKDYRTGVKFVDISLEDQCTLKIFFSGLSSPQPIPIS